MNAIEERNDRIRRAEAELLLPIVRDAIPAGGRILEIGCGRGVNAEILSAVGPVVATDPYAQPSAARGVVFVRARAERLPFPDGTFDLVFSTSVIEHIDDLPAAFDELRRVTTPAAHMLHVVPTHVWKVLSVASHYALLARGAARRIGRLLGAVAPAAGAAQAGVWRQRAPGGVPARSRLLPLVHGTAPSNLAELIQFHPASWQALFRHHGFDVARREELLVYSPPEMPLIPPFAGPPGLASCVAFLLRKRGPADPPAAARR